MSVHDTDMPDQGDEAFARWARARLDESAAAVDPATRERLARARHAAVAHARRAASERSAPDRSGPEKSGPGSGFPVPKSGPGSGFRPISPPPVAARGNPIPAPISAPLSVDGWLPAAAAASVVATVAALVLLSGGGPAPGAGRGAESALLEDLEVLSTEADLDLLRDLDFYEWLETGEGRGDRA